MTIILPKEVMLTEVATCLIRTVIIYFLLILAIRATGKRQIGELEISELVSTFLISEIASLPIGNQEIPFSYAVLPILTIISLEITISFLTTRSAIMKKIFLGSPIILIKRGRLQQKELSKARMSVEELLSELRQNGTPSIGEVDYAILENNGKLSVTPRAKNKPVTVSDLKLNIPETGIAHAIIIDGTVKKEALQGSGLSEEWLKKAIKESKLSLDEIFLMTVDDLGKTNVIKKE